MKMKNKGYTLIEMMVAVAVFTLVIAAPTGFFVTALKGQQKTLSSQELSANVSYVLDYMSRALRMAKKDLAGDCISQDFNYELSPGGNSIKFKNYNDICQEFYLDNGKLKETRYGLGTVVLTPEDLEVVSFKLGSYDSWGQEEDRQAMVTLFLEVKGTKSQRPELQPVIKIQTTVSQRNLDVRY